jgi:Xaa-Pro aminopeptidase
MSFDGAFSGLSCEEKVTRLRDHLTTKKAAAFVVNMLDEVAWLFNLRGSDIAFNPGERCLGYFGALSNPIAT